MTKVEGAIDLLTPAGVSGWLWLPNTPEAAIDVELRIAGNAYRRVTANAYRQDIHNSGRGTGRYGFAIAIVPPADTASVEVVAKVGNLEAIMTGNAPSLICPQAIAASMRDQDSRIGALDACDGDTIKGWAWAPYASSLRLHLVVAINDIPVATVRSDMFREDLANAGIGDGCHAFELKLDDKLDGKKISIFCPELGRHLPMDDRLPHLLTEVTEADTRCVDYDPAEDQHQRRIDIARIFDAIWYKSRYPEVENSGLSPLDHYLDVGSLNGYDPHYLFSTLWYRQQVELSGPYARFPTLHFIDHAGKGSLSPHPLFNLDWYTSHHRLPAGDKRTLVEHFVNEGYKAELGTTPLFDSRWYLEHYPDVMAASVNAFVHYATIGYMEGRSPNAFLDYAFYSDRYPEIRQNRQDPLAHYVAQGASDMADPSPFFSTAGYLNAYPDVSQAQINPLEHFLLHGREEGRSPCGQGAPQVRHSGHLPRFGEAEYGPIAMTLPYDGPVTPGSFDLRICVHLHLFHTDLANEMIEYLKNIPIKFILLISIQEDDPENWNEIFSKSVENIDFCIQKNVRNLGRDVYPWIYEFSETIINYDILLHIHTKKSEYSDDYRNWRRFLLHSTIGSESIATAILQTFAARPDVGLIYPPYFPSLKGQPSWGSNFGAAHRLSERLGCAIPDTCPDYPSGSFFWARVDYLRPLLTCGLTSADFDDETGQVDGTMAHAIERMLGCLPSAQPMQMLCANVDVAFNLTHYWDRSRSQMICAPAQGANSTSIHPPLDKQCKIALYSASIGNFDHFVQSDHSHADIDYFMFSDNNLTDASPFEVRSPRYVDIDDRRTARFVKTHPALYMPEHHIAIWVDANIALLSSLQPFLDVMESSDADLGIVHHAVRSSYVEEAKECIRIGADDKTIIEEQIARYQQFGVPEHGLIETNFMIARMDRPQVRTFFNLWWREIASYSVRDQLSVNFAAHQAGLKLASLLPPGRTVRDDGRFLLFEHALQERTPILRLYGKS